MATVVTLSRADQADPGAEFGSGFCVHSNRCPCIHGNGGHVVTQNRLSWGVESDPCFHSNRCPCINSNGSHVLVQTNDLGAVRILTPVSIVTVVTLSRRVS